MTVAHGSVDDSALEWHQGSPEVLLLLGHATGFCKEVWRPVVSELRELGVGVSSLAWDARGHGSATPLQAPITWWTFGRDLVALVDHLAPSSAVVGVGHSMGGATMVMAELLRPGLLTGMVLVEPVIIPPPYGRLDDLPLATMAARRRPTFPSREAAAASYRPKPLFRRWHPKAFSGYLEGALRPHPDGVALACPPEVESEVYAASSETRIFERLDELRAPVRLLLSDHPGELQHAMEALEGAFPNATTVYLTGQSHMVVMENPGVVAAEIADFLAALELA